MVISNSLAVKTLLQEIAKEKEWSQHEVENDIAILERNRLFHVKDLKALSKESWAVIELLPIVKDLLRSAIDPNWTSWFDENRKDQKRKQNPKTSNDITKNEKNTKKNNNNNSNNNSNKKKNNGEKKKKEKKKEKKEKEIKEFVSPSPLGTPVVPAILTKPSDLLLHPTSRPEEVFPIVTQDYNPTHPTDDKPFSEILSDDHLTIQNTIRNGGAPAYDDDEALLSPSTPSGGRRKSVTFSEENPIIIANSTNEKKKKDDKKKDEKKKKNKNKEKMASSKKKVTNGFNHFTNHPVVKFKKMKKKHCRKLPPVTTNDPFIQGLYEKLTIASKSMTE